MAWTYADWDEQPTTALKLARARLFRTELNRAVTRNVGADGKTVDSGPIIEMLKLLKDDIKNLESLPDSTGTNFGGVSLADFSGG